MSDLRCVIVKSLAAPGALDLHGGVLAGDSVISVTDLERQVDVSLLFERVISRDGFIQQKAGAGGRLVLVALPCWLGRCRAWPRSSGARDDGEPVRLCMQMLVTMPIAGMKYGLPRLPACYRSVPRPRDPGAA